jgi:SAM-dependent methyltransferase
MSDSGGLPGSDRMPPNIRTDIPHPSRVYDYWLGGKDNFAADRQLAEHALQVVPQLLCYARGNRRFLARAIRFLCEAGIRQFLDIGSGLPTSPNVHEIAQQADPEARVVYVDEDPMVYSHAAALLAGPAGVAAVRADMRYADEVLRQAGKLIDFGAPVAVMFVACLHHLEDHDDPVGVVARYLEVAAPGSYLVLSHCTHEHPQEIAADARDHGTTFIPRGKDAIARMFNGRELVDPGLVLVSYWRPDDGAPDRNADRVMAYGGIAAI